MVEQNNELLDRAFMALADSTRRSIIMMLAGKKRMRVTELAAPFSISLAATSKHIKVLEQAGLISRVQSGRDHYLELNIERLRSIKDWLAIYEKFWVERFSTQEEFFADEQVAGKPVKPRLKRLAIAKDCAS